METLSAKETKSWPPERGLPLFLAWIGAPIALALFGWLLESALYYSGTLAPDWLWEIKRWTLLIASYLWQAWLLFRKVPARFAIWVIASLLGHIAPNVTGVVILDFVQISLFALLVQTAMIHRIRQRAWVWLVAGAAGQILNQVSYRFLFSQKGAALLERLDAVLGTGSSMPLVSIVSSWIWPGVSLLDDVIAAAALAWCMPPAVWHGSAMHPLGPPSS